MNTQGVHSIAWSRGANGMNLAPGWLACLQGSFSMGLTMGPMGLGGAMRVENVSDNTSQNKLEHLLAVICCYLGATHLFSVYD